MERVGFLSCNSELYPSSQRAGVPEDWLGVEWSGVSDALRTLTPQIMGEIASLSVV